MIQRSSRTTSLLGSSLNSSQLSVYSHASSVRSGGAELPRVSSGGQASKTVVSGHGYLTSSRTISKPKSQKSAISRARERRKEERRRRVHTVAADEESLSLDGGDTGAKNNDLESYLMSFGGEKTGRLHTVGTKATAKRKSGVQSTSVLPRGSELDWDKLLESGDLELMSDREVQSDDDSVFSDNTEDPVGGLDGSAFLKKLPTRIQNSPGPLNGEQTKGDRVRKISNVSSVKFLGENSSSPTVSDLVLTDSLDSLSSTTHTQTPMATGQPRQVHTTTTRNQFSNSDQSLERNDLHDVKEAADLISTNEIDVDAVSSQYRAKMGTVRSRTSRATPSDSHATISEEQSISESFDFKPNMHVLSSIDQLEADINQLHHHQSEESSFEQNLHDIHSLRELEEPWEDPPQPPRSSDKDIMTTSHSKGENNLIVKLSVSTKQAQFPAQPIPRLSSFKFSAASTAAEDIQHKVDYSSDEFESESVSEVQSIVTETIDSVREDSAIGSGVGELTETIASGVSDDAADDDDDRREERSGDVDTGHSELRLSYSSFSEAEQIDKSELTESQQQLILTSGTRNRPPSTSNKKQKMPSKTSTSTAAGASVHRDACIQTEPLANVSSSSMPAVTGYPSVTVGHHYGKEYLDPSPILPHVVSPDALEAVTGYSPSMVALTNMLRTQLSITRSLVAQTRQLTATVSSSITPNYHYTTLVETKQYIARYRPKLLSLEEARELVQLEHQ